MGEHTGVSWDRACRELCVDICMRNGEAIGGDGVEVEIDETKIGKRKYHRGHYVEGQWVFGGVEKNDSNKTFLVPVPRRDRDTLIPLIQRWILPGSIISSGITNTVILSKNYL